MFLGKKKKRIIITEKSCIFSNTGKLCEKFWASSIFDSVIPELSGYDLEIYANPSVCSELLFEDIEKEKNVFGELAFRYGIRKTDYFSLKREDNGKIIVLRFPKIEKKLFEGWLHRENSSASKLESILNFFSFLCPDDAGIALDFSDYIGAIGKKRQSYTDVFAVSIQDRKADFTQIEEYLKKYVKTVFFTDGVCFNYRGKEYDFKNWQQCIVGED